MKKFYWQKRLYIDRQIDLSLYHFITCFYKNVCNKKLAALPCHFTSLPTFYKSVVIITIVILSVKIEYKSFGGANL